MNRSHLRAVVSMAMALALAVPVAMAAAMAPPAVNAEDDAWTAAQEKRLSEGDRLLKAGRAQASIDEAFEPLIGAYEARYGNDAVRYYCARTPTETLSYMLRTAAEHDSGESDGRNAVALGRQWAYGYFGKAYALVELKRYDEASEALARAQTLAPDNPQFLSERGHLHQIRREWQQMLDANKRAEDSTHFASPEALRDSERARALRGQGFALIELKDLDAAEAAFRTSLELDPDSQLARSELAYIRKLRDNSRSNEKL